MDKLNSWNELVGMTLCDIQTSDGKFDLTFIKGNQHKVRFSATYDDVHDMAVTLQQIVTEEIITIVEHCIEFDD